MIKYFIYFFNENPTKQQKEENFPFAMQFSKH
jgi:hypothetical protein